MARRIFLHVAATKTGTTFLQQVLWANREQTRDQGLLLPGEGVLDHFRAALDVRESAHLVRDPERVGGAWQRLVTEADAWPGDALISHELFSPATAAQAERAVRSFRDAEVHVVVTARDLVRQIPSEWQEHVKHRSVLTFPEFVALVRADPDRGPFSPNGYHFWEAQDLCRILDRWGSTLTPARVHVVTVPVAGSGGDTLWRRFSGLLGLNGTSFDLTSSRTNSTLTAEQAELVRRLNGVLGDRLPLPGSYPAMVPGLLANRVLAGRPGTRFGLLGEERAWAVGRAAELVDGLRDRGVDVVGHLADLVPAAEAPDDVVSGDAVVDPGQVLDEAVEALAETLDLLAQERERRRTLRGRLDELRARRGRPHGPGR